jgi:hypothetical protein
MLNDYDKIVSFFNCNYHICYYGVNMHDLHHNTLQFIQKQHNASNLHMRKMTLFHHNKPQYFNVSDHHVEIDFDILGVQTLHVFHLLFNHIKDANRERKIFVCYNIDNCRQDLVKIFHSFLKYARFKFIFLTRKPSSIPNNISKRCLYICNKINNGEISYHKHHEKYCEIVINTMKKIRDMYSNKANASQYLIELRENLYLLLIHNLNIYDCFYYIFSKCIEYEIIVFSNDKDMFEYMDNMVGDYIDFNMNHRVIYHIEKIILKLIELNI